MAFRPFRLRSRQPIAPAKQMRTCAAATTSEDIVVGAVSDTEPRPLQVLLAHWARFLKLSSSTTSRPVEGWSMTSFHSSSRFPRACQLTTVTRTPILEDVLRNRMSESKSEKDRPPDDRDLYSGLIRLHVLHHAVEGPVFGLGMIEELARHGYRISPGSLYPILQGLEKKGYLRSVEQRNGKSLRRLYRATPLGRKALAGAKSKVRELFHELVEGD